MVEPVAAEGRCRSGGEARQEARKETVAELEPENAKDGVSLDELFKMKPEIFQTRSSGGRGRGQEEG